MKNIIPIETTPVFKTSIERLHERTKQWVSEIKFIKIEQDFLKELLSEHIMGLCVNDKFKIGKLLLNGIEHEYKLGDELIISIKDHRMNLALLMENIYLKKEDDFRKNHELLKNEVKNYIQNFKYIKEQVFELVLVIMKKEKEKKLLHS
jgi:hypothetical protein